ncbi:MAG: hypothetical protein JKY62_16765 [Desulfocapsa sp.]|nr:hypothetical protein [Desulfocapsa sp.]
MTDFSHLGKLQVTSSSTAEYEIIEIEVGDVSPTLILTVTGESNKGYFNALLRATGQGNGQRRGKLKVNTKAMEEMRGWDRDLFPDHVIVGWKNMTDANGKDVKFSVAACKDFIAALPNWIFDGVRAYASDPENFVASIDSEGKAKN